MQYERVVREVSLLGTFTQACLAISLRLAIIYFFRGNAHINIPIRSSLTFGIATSYLVIQFTQATRSSLAYVFLVAAIFEPEKAIAHETMEVTTAYGDPRVARDCYSMNIGFCVKSAAFAEPESREQSLLAKRMNVRSWGD